MPKSVAKSLESRRSGGLKEPLNFVQVDRLKQENIRKEEAAICLYTTFTINPYKPGEISELVSLFQLPSLEDYKPTCCDGFFQHMLSSDNHTI